MMNTQERKIPKPHPHAALIKAWADGATIQFYSKRHQEWRDTAWNHPSWSEDEEYRIKPEADEPWKPKEGEYFFYVSHRGFVRKACAEYSDKVVEDIISFCNCFRTKEEAEAAVPRVKAALKGESAIYERVEWIKFDPKDESTHPGTRTKVLVWLDNNVFCGRFREFEVEFSRYGEGVKTVYWRPLPPLP